MALTNPPYVSASLYRNRVKRIYREYVERDYSDEEFLEEIKQIYIMMIDAMYNKNFDELEMIADPLVRYFCFYS